MIKQLNAIYISNEDRILIRMSTVKNEEFRLWLTRSTCIKFINYCKNLSLKKINLKHPQKEANTIDQFNQDTIDANLNDQLRFKATQILPLGCDPVLIYDISVEESIANSHLSHLLIFHLQSNHNINQIVSLDQLNVIRSLLTTVSLNAQWIINHYTNDSNITNVRKPNTLN